MTTAAKLAKRPGSAGLSFSSFSLKSNKRKVRNLSIFEESAALGKSGFSTPALCTEKVSKSNPIGAADVDADALMQLVEAVANGLQGAADKLIKWGKLHPQDTAMDLLRSSVKQTAKANKKLNMKLKDLFCGACELIEALRNEPNFSQEQWKICMTDLVRACLKKQVNPEVGKIAFRLLKKLKKAGLIDGDVASRFSGNMQAVWEGNLPSNVVQQQEQVLVDQFTEVQALIVAGSSEAGMKKMESRKEGAEASLTGTIVHPLHEPQLVELDQLLQPALAQSLEATSKEEGKVEAAEVKEGERTENDTNGVRQETGYLPAFDVEGGAHVSALPLPLIPSQHLPLDPMKPAALEPTTVPRISVAAGLGQLDQDQPLQPVSAQFLDMASKEVGKEVEAAAVKEGESMEKDTKVEEQDTALLPAVDVEGGVQRLSALPLPLVSPQAAPFELIRPTALDPIVLRVVAAAAAGPEVPAAVLGQLAHPDQLMPPALARLPDVASEEEENEVEAAEEKEHEREEVKGNRIGKQDTDCSSAVDVEGEAQVLSAPPLQPIPSQPFALVFFKPTALEPTVVPPVLAVAAVPEVPAAVLGQLADRDHPLQLASAQSLDVASKVEEKEVLDAAVMKEDEKEEEDDGDLPAVDADNAAQVGSALSLPPVASQRSPLKIDKPTVLEPLEPIASPKLLVQCAAAVSEAPAAELEPGADALVPAEVEAATALLQQQQEDSGSPKADVAQEAAVAPAAYAAGVQRAVEPPTHLPLQQLQQRLVARLRDEAKGRASVTDKSTGKGLEEQGRKEIGGKEEEEEEDDEEEEEGEVRVVQTPKSVTAKAHLDSPQHRDRADSGEDSSVGSERRRAASPDWKRGRGNGKRRRSPSINRSCSRDESPSRSSRRWKTERLPSAERWRHPDDKKGRKRERDDSRERRKDHITDDRDRSSKRVKTGNGEDARRRLYERPSSSKEQDQRRGSEGRRKDSRGRDDNRDPVRERGRDSTWDREREKDKDRGRGTVHRSRDRERKRGRDSRSQERGRDSRSRERGRDSRSRERGRDSKSRERGRDSKSRERERDSRSRERGRDRRRGWRRSRSRDRSTAKDRDWDNSREAMHKRRDSSSDDDSRERDSRSLSSQRVISSREKKEAEVKGAAVAKTEDTAVGKTEGTAVSKVERTAVSKAEDAAVSKTEGIVVAKTEGTAVAKTEGTAVSKAEGTAMSKAEGAAVVKTEGTVVAKTEGAAVSNVVGTAVSKAEGAAVAKAKEDAKGEDTKSGHSAALALPPSPPPPPPAIDDEGIDDVVMEDASPSPSPSLAQETSIWQPPLPRAPTLPPPPAVPAGPGLLHPLSVTVTPSPPCGAYEQDHAVGGDDSDGDEVVLGPEDQEPDDPNWRLIKYEASALIRTVATAMHLTTPHVLNAHHLFHHYHWIRGTLPEADLPAICVACMLLAGKTVDEVWKVKRFLDRMERFGPNLPPFDEYRINPLGEQPTREKVIAYEYEVMVSRGGQLNLPNMHDSLDYVASVVNMSDAAYNATKKVLRSRDYTDCSLCLEEEPTVAILAAAYLAQATMEKEMPIERWIRLLGVKEKRVFDAVGLLEQCAAEVVGVEDRQFFMKVDLSLPAEVFSSGDGGGMGGGGGVNFGGGGGGGDFSRPQSRSSTEKKHARGTRW